jgi:hypothetical protein
MSMIIIYGAVTGSIMCSVYAILWKNLANYNSFTNCNKSFVSKLFQIFEP